MSLGNFWKPHLSDVQSPRQVFWSKHDLFEYCKSQISFEMTIISLFCVPPPIFIRYALISLTWKRTNLRLKIFENVNRANLVANNPRAMIWWLEFWRVYRPPLGTFWQYFPTLFGGIWLYYYFRGWRHNLSAVANFQFVELTFQFLSRILVQIHCRLVRGIVCYCCYLLLL